MLHLQEKTGGPNNQFYAKGAFLLVDIPLYLRKMTTTTLKKPSKDEEIKNLN
jgi:hypothetical protein